jgi:hypothetical protein
LSDVAVAASLHKSAAALHEIAPIEHAPRPRWHVDGSTKAIDIEELEELHRRVERLRQLLPHRPHQHHAEQTASKHALFAMQPVSAGRYVGSIRSMRPRLFWRGDAVKQGAA